MNRRMGSFWTLRVAMVVTAAALVAVSCNKQPAAPAIALDADDVGGVVTGPKGPEAGVWVVAETADLPTKFAKIVVTDDQGRYVLPDLPKANYTVFVRGYGLVDSPKVKATPGQALNLTAVAAPDEKAAAQYYPAGYWASLLSIPDKSEFPGKGGDGVNPAMKSQAEWLAWLKNGSCYTCHQLGDKATRELNPLLGPFPSAAAGWARRIQSGQAGPDMVREIGNFGMPRALAMLSDWTDRINKGELPPAPPRPTGAERNIVITQWHWADEKTYLHDQVSTDRRKPTVNANGLIYGAPELSTENLPILDPLTAKTTTLQVPPRDPKTPVAPGPMMAPSPFFGTDAPWTSRSDVHNPMLDGEGRLWMTARVRPPNTPAYCRTGASHPSAKLFPVTTSTRQVAMYDPKTKKISYIDTCFDTHHLMFAEDANNTLWMNGYGSPLLGFINTKMYLETGDEVKSQGWTGLILDTNGNGKRDAFVGPNAPVDPKKDKQLGDALYMAAPAPDGSVWGTVLGFPGAVVRVVPGDNPTETALAEKYEVPWNDPKAPINGYSPRGMDVDRNGVAWVALGSGHLASFDRRKCTAPLNGPMATGKHCPEGWTLYPNPVPQFKNVTDNGSAEGSYFAWVDQFDTLGLGANTPIATGNESDGYLALKDGKWVVLRVPYPMGFYAKWMDGRIDDPNAGWKGRGLWSTVSTRTPFHMETGKGTVPIVMHFQLRPDPLAK